MVKKQPKWLKRVLAYQRRTGVKSACAAWKALHHGKSKTHRKKKSSHGKGSTYMKHKMANLRSRKASIKRGYGKYRYNVYAGKRRRIYEPQAGYEGPAYYPSLRRTGPLLG